MLKNFWNNYFKKFPIKFSKKIIITLNIRILGTLIILATQVFSARLLDFKNFGYLTIALTMFYLLSSLSRLNVDTSIIKDMPNLIKKNQKKKISSIIKTSFFINLIFFFSYLFLHKFFFFFILNNSLEELSNLMLIFLIIIPLHNYSILMNSTLRSYNYFYITQLLEVLIKPLIILLIIIIIYLNGLDISSFHIGLIYFFSTFFVFLLISFIFISDFLVKFYQKKSNYNFKIIEKSFQIFLGYIFFLLITQTDVLMLGYFQSPEIVALYGPASRISSIIYFIVGVFTYVTSVELTLAVKNKNKSMLKNILMKYVPPVFQISLCYFILIVLFGKFLLGIYGNEFKYAYLSLIILSLGYLSRSFSLAENVMIFSNFHKKLSKIYIFGFIINIILNTLLIPKFGLLGASLATCISLFFINVYPIFFLSNYKNFNVSIFNLSSNKI